MQKHTAQVIWYNQVAGYGFLAVEGYPHDLFIHNSVVRDAKIPAHDLEKGTKLLCVIGSDKKGRATATDIELA